MLNIKERKEKLSMLLLKKAIIDSTGKINAKKNCRK
jgi:hypothetical protein